MSQIMTKIKQRHQTKNTPTLEEFVYATDWLKSTQGAKTFDEVLISLVDYCKYIDKQKAKVEIYFIEKSKDINTKPLYSNFQIWKKEQALNDMDSQKYNAYIYSQHYSKALSQTTKKEKVTIIRDNAKQAKQTDCFGSKK